MTTLVFIATARELAVAAAPSASSVPAAPRVEPWADPKLTETSGLILWLDATRQTPAWQAHGRAALDPEDRVDVVYDGSGNRLNATQRVQSSQPNFQTSGGSAALRFDGEDDHLWLGNVSRQSPAITVFVVALPTSNLGFFRGLFAGCEAGKNDYTTGINIDLGPGASTRFNVLNVEGAGQIGIANLLTPDLTEDFGRPLVLTVTTAPGPGNTRLFVGGKPGGRRDRAADSVVRLDEIVVGARAFSNTADPPAISGHFDGDIAEVLVYEGVLDDARRGAVERYLTEKHAGLTADVATGPGKRLVQLKDPPAVQVLVPGFEARQLPLKLKNVNNLRYREDGMLVALGYDGTVHLLADTDGDGLEDKATFFWDNKSGGIRGPIGMALTPPGYKAGRGVFVTAKGRVSLLLDADADDVAEREVIVAEGWTELPHGVDALGAALDAEGNLYFGLGTTNFTNGHLVNAQGKAEYSLRSERGTILKVSPDFKKREIVCTGIRFPVALAFNRAGDLFCTDQEGATWLPNGNPLDELLHIQTGRHYGFPPRHPKHLPMGLDGKPLIDEPSVYDYAPQHQSTCGLFFNDLVNGGPTFGPAHWSGDAIVCGASRGKIYRTRLAKTPAGYVAQNQIIASITMLAIDACVSPRGELVIAAHGGQPDWGSGPQGEGRLYKIVYADRKAPQPVLTWAAAPDEVRVAFDRSLEPAHLRDLLKGTRIDYGRSVRAGDRFEAIRPGYEVVVRQMREPRFELPVLSAAVTPDRRTLVLSTARHPAAAHYALTLPGLGRSAEAGSRGAIQQVAETDLDYDLGGVEASFRDRDGQDIWSGWLPHLDLAAAATFTASSASHDALWAALRQTKGQLLLRAKLDLHRLLRPAVQPGSQLDYPLPESDRVTVTFASVSPVEVRSPGAEVEQSRDGDGRHRASFTVETEAGAPVPIEVRLHTTGSAPASLSMSYHTDEDARPRALQTVRVIQPWAPTMTDTIKEPPTGRAPIPELAGGDWMRGRTVYFADDAMCGRCHRIAGEGGQIGPDLSNLRHRDYASVYRDVTRPSDAINPDHVAYAITLADGTVLAGVPRSVGGGKVIVGEAGGKETSIDEALIKTRQSLGTSIMPHGIQQVLGASRTRDLMTFLLTEPLDPAPIEAAVPPPPPRARAAVEAVLNAAEPEDRKADAAPLRVLLSAGPKDHGPGEHDYPKWQERWAKLLAMSDGVQVAQCQGFPKKQQLDAADVVVFYSNNPGWVKEKAAHLDAFLARGGGLIYIHYAVDGHGAPAELAQRIGLAWRLGSKFRHGDLDLKFTDRAHPITRGFETLALHDESYWNLLGEPAHVHELASAPEEGADQPLLWVREQGKGRVFISIPGHYAWTFDDPLFRVLILRGIAWTAGRPAERLTHLATIGARIQ